MSTGAQNVGAKIDVLIDINKRMLATMTDPKKGGAKDEKKDPAKKGSSLDDKDIERMASLSTALAATIKAIDESGEVDPDKGKAVAQFIINFSEGISDMLKTFDTEKLVAYTNFLNVVMTGSGKFIRDMALLAILTPLAMIGAAGFALTLRIMLWVLKGAEAANESVIAGLKSVMTIAKGAFAFGLSLSLFLLISPFAALGALAFITLLTGLSAGLGIAMYMAGNGSKDSPLYKLKDISMGMAVFALTLVAFALAGEFLAKGALAFVMILIGISFGIGIAQKLSGSGGKDSGLYALLKLGTSLIIFAITLALFAVLSPLIALGAIVLVLAILGISWVLKKSYEMLDGKNNKNNPVNNLDKVGKGLLWIGLALALTGLASPLIAIGAIVMILALWGLSWALTKFGTKEVGAGIKNLDKLAYALLPMAIVIVILALIPAASYLNVLFGALAIAGLILLLGGAAYLLNVMDKKKDVTKGLKLMESMGETLLIIAGATGVILILSKIPLKDYINVAIGAVAVAAFITIIGLAAYFIGQPYIAPFIGAGVVVLLLMAGALLVFAEAVKILSEIKLDASLAEGLGTLITKVGVAVGGLGWAAAGGSLVLIPMAAGLYAMSFAVKKFQEINYQPDTGVMMGDAVKSIVAAFTEAFKDLSFKQWININAGIQMVVGMGKALASLADGVAKMANAEVVEYEVKGKGKDQVLVPKGTVKLTKTDFKNAGDNVSAILEAITIPLFKFGYMMSNGERLFSDGYIEKGLEGLVKMSTSLGALAEGVAKMANAEVIMYDIVGKGTADAKLVPSGYRKLTGTIVPDANGNGAATGDFLDAGNNVSAILNAMTIPLFKFGYMMSIGEGTFKNGYIEKGLDGLVKISTSLGGLADGVLKMASGEVVMYEVINAGTADAKIVPSGSRKLTGSFRVSDDGEGFATGDYKAAGDNVSAILGAMTIPLRNFGFAIKEGEGWFEGGFIEAGIEGLASLTAPLASLADMMIKLGSGQFQTQVLSKDKKGNPILVPGEMLNITGVMAKAKLAIVDMLNFIPLQFASFGTRWGTLAPIVAKGMDGLDIVNKGMETLAVLVKNYTDIALQFEETEAKKIAPEKMLLALSSSLDTLGTTFSKKMRPMELMQLTDFNNEMQKLANMATPFEKFVKSFGLMADHMKTFSTNFKLMDAGGITAFKDWTDSMVMISKVDVSKSGAIVDFVNKAVSAAFGGGTDPAKPKPGTEMTPEEKKAAIERQNEKDGAGKPGGEKAEPAAKIDMAAITSAITQALQNLSVQTINVQGDIVKR